MGRKNYNTLEELIGDLDHETLFNDEENELLDDDDLALLHGPDMSKVAPEKKQPPRKKKPARRPKK